MTSWPMLGRPASLKALDVHALVADDTDRGERGQPAAVGLRVDDRP
jgi:hypothetical protein